MKLFILTMIFALSSFGGIYDYNYSSLEQESTTTERNPLMYGDFDKIIRFKALHFNENNLTEASYKELDTIVKSVNEYKVDEKKLGVSIIAYTQAVTDDKNEEAIASKTYANKIQNWFRKDLDKNTSEHISEAFAADVQKLLIEKGIDKNMTVLEVGGANNPAYSDATSEGRALSNRVMVALYVYTPEDIEVDSDGDGVFDKRDACPETPKGVRVDLKGCPLDTDGDGVYDYKDQCPGTSKGIEVNNDGCPLDSDGDGVYDYKDQCPGTPKSFKVDLNGCPLSKKLMLTFESRSYNINDASYAEVEEFATFLKENPQYKAEIVGHTDSVGKKEYNMTLSQGRANSAKKALIKEGVAASRLKSRGRGELEPIANNRTPEGRQANRRIEVKLFY
ncbi:MAG: OmpA family protein [Helicobacteraceae bacterium]|nr:OmpA family protein [Helicobacteraceae bacterium]